ncbi:MAG: hypothetical protein RR892_05995 [Lachnospiraceae bacterium]
MMNYVEAYDPTLLCVAEIPLLCSHATVARSVTCPKAPSTVTPIIDCHTLTALPDY